MRNGSSMRLLGMAACGLVGGVGSLAYAQPYVINLSGSTAAQSFLTAPALTNDFFDVDGNGVARVFNTNDQLAPAGLPPSPRNGGNPTGQWWLSRRLRPSWHPPRWHTCRWSHRRPTIVI